MSTQRLKTQAYFSSRHFALANEEDEGERWNHELANFIADGLRAKGFSVTDPFEDGHGHGMEIANETFGVLVGCGGIDGDEFTVFVHPSAPTVRKWFRTYPTEPVLKPLLAALDELLADPRIVDVRWELP